MKYKTPKGWHYTHTINQIPVRETRTGAPGESGFEHLWVQPII